MVKKDIELCIVKQLVESILRLNGREMPHRSRQISCRFSFANFQIYLIEKQYQKWVLIQAIRNIKACSQERKLIPFLSSYLFHGNTPSADNFAQ